MRENESLWKVEQPKDQKDGYSVDKFYTASQDSRGKSITYPVKVPSYYAPMIAQAREDFPEIKTVGDYFRDGAIHRNHQLYANKESIQLSPRHLMFRELEEANSMSSQIANMRDLPPKIKRVCEDLRQMGDHITLADYISRTAITANSFLEPWRTRVLEVLEMYSDKWPGR